MYVCSLEYFYKSIIILINLSFKSNFIICYYVDVAVVAIVIYGEYICYFIEINILFYYFIYIFFIMLKV